MVLGDRFALVLIHGLPISCLEIKNNHAGGVFKNVTMLLIGSPAVIKSTNIKYGGRSRMKIGRDGKNN